MTRFWLVLGAPALWNELVAARFNNGTPLLRRTQRRGVAAGCPSSCSACCWCVCVSRVIPHATILIRRVVLVVVSSAADCPAPPDSALVALPSLCVYGVGFGFVWCVFVFFVFLIYLFLCTGHTRCFSHCPQPPPPRSPYDYGSCMP